MPYRARQSFHRTAFSVCAAILYVWLGLAWAGAALAAQTIWQAEIAQGRVMPAASASTDWRPVQLDDSWRRAKPAREGMWTYRITWQLDQTPPPGDAWAALIHRGGNRLQLWLNGVPVGEFGLLTEPDADYSNRALYTTLPAPMLQTGRNELLIQVAGDARRYSGLSHLELGRHAELYDDYARQDAWRWWSSVSIIALGVFIAFVCLGFGLWRRDRTALVMAFASVVCSVRTWLWMLTDLPLPYIWWFVAIDLCYGLTVGVMGVVFLQLSGIQARWLLRMHGVVLLAFIATSLATGLGAPAWIKSLGLDLTIVAATLTYVLVLRQAWRCPRGPALALSLAGLPMLAAGVRDHWNVWMSPAHDAYSQPYLTHFIILFFILAITVLLAIRFDRALRAEARNRRELEEEVARQRAELEAMHRREREQVRTDTLAHERARLLRDMHDGLGAHLTGLLSTVQHLPDVPGEIEQEVQEALLQLRLTIDAMEPYGGDVATLLGQLRYRLEPRLRRAGLDIDWQVDELPETDWEAPALSSLQRLLHEGFANILKHARASCITVRAGCQDGRCFIVLADNGQGFDPACLTPGRGLGNMRERARQLGMDCSIDSAGHGARLQLSWPCDHVPTAA